MQRADVDSLALRKLRKMYQVALIGLLRGSGVDEQFKLIKHVADRVVDIEGQNIAARAAWRMLLKLIGEYEQANLTLTLQRRHLFSRFDRLLKQMIAPVAERELDAKFTAMLRELAYLLDIAGQREFVEQQLNAIAEIDPVRFTDNAIQAQRKAIESGLKAAFSAMSDAVNERFSQLKQRLSMMSESEVCEPEDLEFLTQEIDSVAAVLMFCGFTKPAKGLVDCRTEIEKWVEETPEQADLLVLADAILVVENALLCYSLGSMDGRITEESEMTLEEGLTHQAHKHLFEEMQANLSLANRAVTSYIDSEYDREHIANVASCLKATVGAFKIIGVTGAAELMESCANLVEKEYKKVERWESHQLDSLADSLVSTEYLLHELAGGRALEATMDQLIKDNLDAVNRELAA